MTRLQSDENEAGAAEGTYLAIGDGLQEVAFAATVLTNKSVPSPNRQLNRTILNELRSANVHGEAGNLDVLRRLTRR